MTDTTREALTYKNQPNNDTAWALGKACRQAADASAGDYIDRGLVLLRELQAEGFGIVALATPEQAAQPAVPVMSDVRERFWRVTIRCWKDGKPPTSVDRAFIVKTTGGDPLDDDDAVAQGITQAQNTAEFGPKWIGFELVCAATTQLPVEVAALGTKEDAS